MAAKAMTSPPTPNRYDELEEEVRRLRRSAASLRGRNQQLERQLLSTRESKARFLASVAHELRTPLGGLLILAELLAENASGRLGPKEIEHAHNIQRAGRDLRQVLDEVTEFAKAEAGLLEPRPGPVDLGDFLRELDEEFRPDAEERGLALRMESAPDLPDRIESDRRWLARISRVLVGNALRSMDDGEVVLRLGRPTAEDARQRLRRIVFEVEDQAPALPAEMWQTIFEPLGCVESRTRRKHGGMGLGLATSKRLAELLGGRLSMTSVEGRGNTFTLELPV